jgi:hypothetical protein
MLLKNPVTPGGIDPGTVRLVAQRLNHYATPGPEYLQVLSEYYSGVVMVVVKSGRRYFVLIQIHW